MLAGWLKFMFFCDALVWFAVALEAVLEFAVAVGKLRQNFITAWRGVTQPNGLAETDHPPNRKAMTDDPGLVKLAHDVTPMMLSVFARDPSSPAADLVWARARGRHACGSKRADTTRMARDDGARAGKAKRVNIQSGCIL